MTNFQLIRSATVKITFNDTVILIDPFFAPKLSLPSFAGISKNPLTDLPGPVNEIMDNVDVVFVSHLHTDHFDAVAKESIDKNIPLFCQPCDLEAIKKDGFTNVNVVENSVSVKGIEVERFAGQHGYDDVLAMMGQVSGFTFTADDLKICWLGDTVFTPEIEQILVRETPDVVVVHACGAMWNKVKIVCDEADTVQICDLLPESKVIATHMDSLDHGTVSRSQLREYARKMKVEDNQLFIPEDGEKISLSIRKPIPVVN